MTEGSNIYVVVSRALGVCQSQKMQIILVHLQCFVNLLQFFLYCSVDLIFPKLYRQNFCVIVLFGGFAKFIFIELSTWSKFSGNKIQSR